MILSLSFFFKCSVLYVIKKKILCFPQRVRLNQSEELLTKICISILYSSQFQKVPQTNLYKNIIIIKSDGMRRNILPIKKVLDSAKRFNLSVDYGTTLLFLYNIVITIKGCGCVWTWESQKIYVIQMVLEHLLSVIKDHIIQL